MIKSLFEEYPKLSAEEYTRILKMIKHYVKFRYANLNFITQESMMDAVVDKVFDSLHEKKMTPKNTDEVTFKGFIKRAVNFASDDYYYYNIRTQLPKQMSFAKFKALSNKMNEEEKQLFRRLYIRKNELGVYKKKEFIDQNDRNALEDIFKKYKINPNVDALTVANQNVGEYLRNPEEIEREDSEDMYSGMTAPENVEQTVLNNEYNLKFNELLSFLGYNEKEIKCFNLLRMYDMNHRAVGEILSKDKALAKTMLKTNNRNQITMAYNAKNIATYLKRLLENLEEKALNNKDILKQKGLIESKKLDII